MDTNGIRPRSNLQMFVFVCVEALRPTQQFFSHVGAEPPHPGYYQYFRGVKCLAQGHNTEEVSNPRHLAPESDALPLSYRSRNFKMTDKQAAEY